MNFLKSVIQKIVVFFSSGKAAAALNQAASLVPKALPIVEAIAALTPNRTIQEIEAAFEKYAVPFSQEWRATPAASRGYLLLQLATSVLSREVPGTATNILNSAVQLAVTGSKA
jgi:acyl-CoA reductase-like NAD-dependent aldehyde dehydrogenase